MRIEFQNTQEDFREAAELIAASDAGTRLDEPVTAGHFLQSIGNYGAAAFIALVWLSMQVAPFFDRDAPDPPQWAFVHLFMPFLMATAVTAGTRGWRVAADGLARRTPLRCYRRAMLPAGVVLFFIALILLLRRYAFSGLGDIRTQPLISWPLVWAFIFPHVGWIAITIGAQLDHGRASRALLDDAWDEAAAYAQPRTLEAGEAFVRITDRESRTEHDWHVFSRFFETPNLFLLLISPQHFHAVPKRAVPGAEVESAFRDLLVRNIEKRPVAFPVLPVGSTKSPPRN